MSDSFGQKASEISSDLRNAESRVTLRFERFASFVEEYSSNISLGGVFIKTHKARPVGTEIHFEFKLVDGFRLLHGQGQVVWVRLKDHGESAPAGMGVRFTAIDESGRQLVLKLLEEQVKSGGAPFEVETVPQDADGSPPSTAGEVDLPDLSEEPTLIGHVPAVELPDPNTSAQLGGDGFDAPWGSNLPSIPNDLLDEENDPEVEKAVRSIRPDPALDQKASPEPAPASAPAESAETPIPTVSTGSVFEAAAEPAAPAPQAAAPLPEPPAAAPEISMDEPAPAPPQAPAEDLVPAATALPLSVEGDVLPLESQDEEPLSDEPIFEIDGTTPTQQLDLLGDEEPTLVKPADSAEVFNQEQLVFEPPPEDELPFDPELGAKEMQGTPGAQSPAVSAGDGALAAEPAFELEAVGTDPSLEATDFNFVSSEDEAATTDAESQSHESWITSAAPLPPTDGGVVGSPLAAAAFEPPAETPIVEPGEGAGFEPAVDSDLDAGAVTFDSPSFTEPAYEVPSYEPESTPGAEISFGDLNEGASAPALAPAPTPATPSFEAPGFETPESFAAPAEEAAFAAAPDPGYASSEEFADPGAPAEGGLFEVPETAPIAPDPAFGAPAVPEAPVHAAPVAGGVDAAAPFAMTGSEPPDPPIPAPEYSEPGALDSGPPDPALAEAPAFEMPADSAAFAAAPAPPPPEGAAPPFSEAGEAPGAPHTGLFANPEGEAPLEATEEWPNAEEGAEDWMQPEPSSRRWIPVVAALLIAAVLGGAYFFRQPLAKMVGLGGDEPQIAQGPPPGQQQGRPAEANRASSPGQEGESAEGAGADLASEGAGSQGQGGRSQPGADSGSGGPGSGGSSPGDSAPGGSGPGAPGSGASGSGASGSGRPADSGPASVEAEKEPSPAAQPAGSRASASPPPRAAPPPPAAAPSNAASSSRRTGGAAAGQVVDVSWQRQSTGTRVTIQFDGRIDASRFRHDKLAWAADRERIIFSGLENFRLGKVDVGTPELQRIRIGHHPGQELHFVFDLAADGGAALAELSPDGERLNILVQRR